VLGLSKPERFVRVHARADGLVPQLEHGRVSMPRSYPSRASPLANPAGEFGYRCPRAAGPITSEGEI